MLKFKIIIKLWAFHKIFKIYSGINHCPEPKVCFEWQCSTNVKFKLVISILLKHFDTTLWNVILEFVWWVIFTNTTAKVLMNQTSNNNYDDESNQSKPFLILTKDEDCVEFRKSNYVKCKSGLFKIIRPGLSSVKNKFSYDT